MLPGCNSMKKFINQIEPVFGEEEKKAMAAYMDSGGWVTEFKETRKFESMIASATGAKHCSVVANGTDALVASLLAVGVKPGDEVISPDYTFVATPNAAELLGAKAVFADVEPQSMCLDFSKMKSAITRKTKAVIFVSMNARYPQDLLEMAEYCKGKGIWFIEDAAQSLGSTAFGRQLGTIGDLGTYSLSSPKIITSGQGGAIVTGNSELYEKILLIRNFGRTSPTPYSDSFDAKGWNFKFTDIQAIIGMEQLKKLPARVKRRKEMGKLYFELLGKAKGVELIPTDFSSTALFAYDLLTDRRGAMQEFLKASGIGTRFAYPPLHSEKAYGYPGSYPVSESVGRRGLWLPSSNNLSDAEISFICGKVSEFCGKKA
ncbi:Aspartate aminotransferase [uncultured archaeon]|nr:Aspartate aminotransferase [uncultured archaeon]